MASIWDADILIWAASTLIEMRERGVNDLPRTLQFHPYNLLKAIQRDTGGRQYELSDWIYEGIVMDGGVLAVHPDYFRLTGGLERCVYRIARKHAGTQQHGWSCTVATLYSKTGSDSSSKEFTRMLRKVVEIDELPEYHLSWIKKTESDEPAVHMIRRSLLPANHAAFAFTSRKSRTRPQLLPS